MLIAIPPAKVTLRLFPALPMLSANSGASEVIIWRQACSIQRVKVNTYLFKDGVTFGPFSKYHNLYAPIIISGLLVVMTALKCKTLSAC